jgi:hypothetical protein
MLIGVLGLGISTAQSQTYINSWENSLEGWSLPNTNFVSGGFSTTGVMAGTNSWVVSNTTGNFLWNQDGTQPDLQGPSSVGLTTLLANGSSVSVDVTVPTSGDFGWGMGFSLYLNQPGGAGIMPIPTQWAQWLPSGGPLPTTTLTFTIPDSVRFAMKANPGVATSLRFCLGSGNAGTMYLDGLRIAPYEQVNSWEYGLEGWTIVNTNFAFGGLSNTNGASAGLYSLVVSNTTGNFAWNQDGTAPDFRGPSTTDLTALMSKATNVAFEVTVPNSGDFGWGMGFSLYLNQPGGGGIMAIPASWQNWLPSGGPVPTTTFNFPVPPAVRVALLNNPTLPCYFLFCLGSGNAGMMNLDNLRVGLLPPAAANLFVRELWDDQGSDALPANTTVTNGPSSAGFDAASPWVVNPAETINCALMGFRSFNNEPLAGAATMCLPGTLDGSFGCMIQQNSGFSFFPGAGVGSFWTAGDFMTRQMTPGNYIDFQAAGDYWFSVTIANAPTSQYGQYVTQPATGAGGIGFADGSNTNANFVAIGASALNLYLGPGATNVSKALYISQGTLGQPGDPWSVSNSPAPTGTYSQTNFTGGPYHINAYSANSVGKISGDYITLLGHLTTHGDGTATLQAKYYGTGIGGNIWNTELDTTTNSITWDTSYSFSFGGTMTKMLLFQNGQFPYYMFGFRASKNFQDVVGLDPGRIAVAPLANTFVGYALNMTNLAVEANSWSFASPPGGYGTLDYQWYQNGSPLAGATAQYLNFPSAVLTNAGTYTCVATDPSGTWSPVTNSVAVTVTMLNPPTLANMQILHNGNTFMVTFDEPNLTGADMTNHYVFTGGVVATNVTLISSLTTTRAQITTTALPLGTRITLTISGMTNVVGGTLVTTNLTFWTDLVQSGAVNWDAWLAPAGLNSAYFTTWLPANPVPVIGQSMARTSWDGPSSGVTMVGLDGFVGDDFGDKFYGWFIPPVTTNYVFYISADDGARLLLSTNSSGTNMFVIACETDWSGSDQWTNISNLFGQTGSGPHRGDGTANAGIDAGVPPAYVWDNSVSGQSPATACLQNRSDQFIVAFYDSTGLPGGPAGATTSWAGAESKVEFCVPTGMTNFWPNRDVNGQALIHLQAGQMYYMELEHWQNGGGYSECVSYKIAGQPDPLSPSASILTGSNIAGTVPFVPTLSITKTGGVPLITYTGILLAGTNLVGGVTNVVAQSSGATAISLGGPSQYSPPPTSPAMFYRTSR